VHEGVVVAQGRRVAAEHHLLVGHPLRQVIDVDGLGDDPGVLELLQVRLPGREAVLADPVRVQEEVGDVGQDAGVGDALVVEEVAPSD
jgi:hypothetical protein